MKKGLRGKKASTATKSEALNKQFMLRAVQLIAEKVIMAKAKNQGKVPYGFLKKLLHEGKETFPKMSRRTINNYVNKLEKKVAVKKVVILRHQNASSSISKLTEESFLTQANPNELMSKASHEAPPLNTTAMMATDAEASHEAPPLNAIATMATYAPSTHSANDADDVVPSSKKYGGRPKGSTASNILEQKKMVEKATQAAVKKLAELQSSKSKKNHK